MSKAVCLNLVKQFSLLKQNCAPDFCEASLVDDSIDQWELAYYYPEHQKAKVRLHLQFSLTENLPPKVTVLEPQQVSYVCFAELGASNWPKDGNNIATLLIALRFAIASRYIFFLFAN